MKKMFLFGCMTILAASSTLVSCSSSEDNSDNIPGGETTTAYKWGTDAGLVSCDHLLFADDTKAGKDDAADASGNQIGNGDQEFVFTGNQTLKKGTYLLKGWVYIANGAQLKIEPGTIIKGDKNTKAALIVERGGKLYAEGKEDAPIVFTSAQAAGSRKPGDWGGVILCGKAPNNAKEQQIEGGPRAKHGGSDSADNSGTLQYVRIEFAGYPFATDKEINGLTLGSVGSGTTINHIQVSYSNDDSYEWFGGTVNCKYLIAYKGWDDDFDTDNGFSGNVQYGLVIRDSKIADGSQSNSFESDNNATGSDVDPYTKAVFSNITFIGPKYTDASFQNTSSYINGSSVYPNNGSALGIYQSAMHIRRNSSLSCFNSVAVGYPVGIILDAEKPSSAQGTGTQANASNNKLAIQNVVFAGMDATGSDFNKVYKDELYDYTTKKLDGSKKSFSSTWFLAQTGNKAISDMASLGLDTKIPYLPTASSMLLKGASFTNTLLGSWFDKVTYTGAFGTTNWTANWANFDPQNAVY